MRIPPTDPILFGAAWYSFGGQREFFVHRLRKKRSTRGLQMGNIMDGCKSFDVF